MSKFVSHSMSTEKFMVLAGNVIKKSFFDSSRVVAKRIYGDISKGKRINLLKVAMADQSTLDCAVSMDCSEYRGAINFSQFRRHLALLLTNFSRHLEVKAATPVLSSDNGKSHVFNIPAIASDGTHVNAMVLSWEIIGAGAVDFRILYLDPEQFRKPAAAEQGEA